MKIRLLIVMLLPNLIGCAEQLVHKRFSAVPVASSISALPLCSSNSKPKSWSVSVGVDQYKDSRIPTLEGASHDAWVMHHYFISPKGGGVPLSQSMLLLNHKATRANFEFALGRFLARACPQDTIYIYFAGHGAPEPDRPDDAFLFTYDTLLDNLVGTSLSMRQLPEFLKWRAGEVGNLVMLLDACHSGQINFPNKRGINFASAPSGKEVPVTLSASEKIEAQKEDEQQRVEALFSQIKKLNRAQPKWSVLTAASSTQLAGESGDKEQCPYASSGYKGGLFTCSLIEGLKGKADQNKDYKTKLSELHSFVENRVESLTQGAQSPQWLGSDSELPTLRGDLIIPNLPKGLLRPPTRETSTLSKSLIWGLGVSAISTIGFSASNYLAWDKLNTFNNDGRATVSAGRYAEAEQAYNNSHAPLMWSAIATSTLLLLSGGSYLMDQYHQPSYTQKTWFSVRGLK